ncbi:hypothetical protein D3C84_886630 [compost metagenome]
MVLRDLPQGRIGRRDDRNDLRQHRVGHLRATKFLWHADAPQATVGIQVDDLGGHLARTVALGVLLQQDRSDALGHAQGFGFIGDPMGGRRVDRINGRFRHTSLSATVFTGGHCSFCA